MTASELQLRFCGICRCPLLLKNAVTFTEDRNSPQKEHITRKCFLVDLDVNSDGFTHEGRRCLGFGRCSGNFAGPKHCSHECRVEMPPGCDVSTPTGFPVGEITKKWRGPLVEFFTNADRFSVWCAVGHRLMITTTSAPHKTMAALPPATIRVQPGPQVQMMSVNGLAANNQAEIASLWMTVPQPIAGVPPGLEYLTMVDQIVVHQLLEFREIILNYQTRNKYVLLNANGEQEVLRITRPFKCCGGGDVDRYIDRIGSVVQRRACCASSFDVKDENDRLVLTIDGPFIACGRNVEFPVTTPSGTPSGSITKKWRGFLREMYTNADTFSVSFPLDLDVKSKALLLGATFMIMVEKGEISEPFTYNLSGVSQAILFKFCKIA
ncbi:Scramblase [Teladorsagia circumcincta]|uniref:Phospholipid scramblase n=2 Tax=Teladorsagia circumcincta TaxID=45464 RepID=A0A2G9UNI2_TELCI|nr:Scramblase [Teladorsagia circumcincta]